MTVNRECAALEYLHRGWSVIPIREHGPLPQTIEAQTGGGGRQIYFAHPGGVVRNKVDLNNPDKLIWVDMVGWETAISLLEPDDIFTLGLSQP